MNSATRGAIQIVSTPKSMGIPKIAIAFTTIPLLMAIISAAPVLFVEKKEFCINKVYRHRYKRQTE